MAAALRGESGDAALGDGHGDPCPHFVASFVGNFVESNRESSREGAASPRPFTLFCDTTGLCRKRFSPTCTEPPRPPGLHKLTVRQPEGRASRPRHAATRRDRRAARRMASAQAYGTATERYPGDGAQHGLAAVGLQSYPAASSSTPSAHGGDAASTNHAPPFAAGISQTDAISKTISRPFRASRHFGIFPRALPWAGISRPFRAVISLGTSRFLQRTRRSGATRMAQRCRAGSKRVDKDSVPFKSGFRVGAPHYTLSPHFVSTLCRIRFVSILRPYALSKAKDGAASGVAA